MLPGRRPRAAEVPSASFSPGFSWFSPRSVASGRRRSSSKTSDGTARPEPGIPRCPCCVRWWPVQRELDGYGSSVIFFQLIETCQVTSGP
jgi:hypothetical protein